MLPPGWELPVSSAASHGFRQCLYEQFALQSQVIDRSINYYKPVLARADCLFLTSPTCWFRSVSCLGTTIGLWPRARLGAPLLKSANDRTKVDDETGIDETGKQQFSLLSWEVVAPKSF